MRRARQHVAMSGIPLVHIESHGSDPLQTSDTRDAQFGTNAAPGLAWAEFGQHLAPLNAACGFELLVVAATCFGYAAINGMKVFQHTAPFAACVGFSTKIGPGSLHDSMKELYRSMCHRKEPLQDAIAAAGHELREPGESVELIGSTIYALRIMRSVYNEYREGANLSRQAGELLKDLTDSGVEVPAQVIDEMPTVLARNRDARIRQMWNLWFPEAAQQKHEAYRLNWEWVERADFVTP